MASEGDAIYVVQFIHPGGEHRPDATNRKPWNRKRHRRTYVQSPGTYLRALRGKPRTATLHFWCEWECQADCICRFDTSEEGLPKFLFRPWIDVPPSFDGHANTDPCVFGRCFRYCVCQQERMPPLAAGSVILFGSSRQGAFVLDTVFVVASHELYDKHNWRKLDVEPEYRDAALAPLFTNDSGCREARCTDVSSWRLYLGATFDDPVDAMFSFFPCRPENHESGFARPVIELDGFVTPTLPQGYKAGKTVDRSVAKEAWANVAKQVLHDGLSLGVSADMPPYQPQ